MRRPGQGGRTPAPPAVPSVPLLLKLQPRALFIFPGWAWPASRRISETCRKTQVGWQEDQMIWNWGTAISWQPNSPKGRPPLTGHRPCPHCALKCFKSKLDGGRERMFAMHSWRGAGRTSSQAENYCNSLDSLAQTKKDDTQQNQKQSPISRLKSIRSWMESSLFPSFCFSFIYFLNLILSIF